jgi:quinol-cytochrome oxidoreductase complex cytochrome b subunit
MIASVLSLCSAIALLTIWAVVFWFVCSWIGMSANAVMVVRALIVALALMISLQDIVSWWNGAVPRALSMDRVPSIMTPERR